MLDASKAFDRVNLLTLFRKLRNRSNFCVTSGNYRPISVLPVVSKIIENVMHNQMMDYFTSNELFSSQQYGFRPNRSTELAALELMDRNIDNMNHNFSPINIYIDLCKAFDCLDHAILLSKLKYYGLNDNAIKLLKIIYLIETNMCNWEILNHNITTFPVEFPRDL